MKAVTKIPSNKLKFKSVDFRPIIKQMGLEVKDQNPRGTCSVFASTFLLEYMTCVTRGLGLSTQTWLGDQKRAINFSEEYLNSVANLARQKLGATEKNPDGDTFQGCWWGYNDYGIVSEEWFPYKNVYDSSVQPDAFLLETGKLARFFKANIFFSEKAPTIEGGSPKGLSDDQLSSVLAQLDAGIPVAFGVHLSSTTTSVNFGSLGIWDDHTDETVNPGGHSIAIVGYYSSAFIPSGGYFVFRNSWGKNWGDEGYGYLTYNFARKHVYDVVTYESKLKPAPWIEMPKKEYKIDLKPPTWHSMDKLGKLIHPYSRVS